MSIDTRTRIDHERTSLDPREFLDSELPTRFAEAADRLAEPAARIAPAPLTIELPDESAWTLTTDGEAPRVVAGAGDGGVVRLDAEQIDDLATDQATPMTWLTSNTLHLRNGARLEALLDWWLFVRGALDGSTPYVPGTVDVTGTDGEPLELDRVFSPDDSTDEMSDFLHRAGYVHIGGLFTEAEMAAVSDDMDRAAPRYSPDDGRSWWAELGDGTNALVRMQGFDEESPAVADLVADDRLQRLAGLTGDGHTWGQRGRQPDRGVVQADRRAPRHLRRPVAQGLLARTAQLRVLLDERRDLGHGSRRNIGPASGRRRFAPCARLAGAGRASRAATCRSSISRPGPATSRSTCRAHCTWPSRRSTSPDA